MGSRARAAALGAGQPGRCDAPDRRRRRAVLPGRRQVHLRAHGARQHLIRTTIAELAAQLDPAGFAQIHRSTIVNLRHLASTRRDEASRLFVRLQGHAQELPVSRAYVHLFKGM
jgi:DNA-binding LytR/AlgR family response regulator